MVHDLLTQVSPHYFMEDLLQLPRSSGVLLHITCLPGPHGSGDFGASAYAFVDWLVKARQRLWQVLPLTSIGLGNSPYVGSSAFAGNPLLIDLDALQTSGWLPDEDDPTDCLSREFEEGRVNFDVVVPYRMSRLRSAWQGFRQQATAPQLEALAAFCQRESFWIDDYALFMSLQEHYATDSWLAWPRALADRQPAALEQARALHADRIDFWCFCQWCFCTQWLKLKRYANQRDVNIIGDLPMFVGHESADVWAHPALFDLDETGRNRTVAGAPPDAFSDEGQRWGAPLYCWAAHARDDFQWWVRRFRSAREVADIVRIDHFRGLIAFWEVPAEAASGRGGRWRRAPGTALLDAVVAALGPLHAIAEEPDIFIADVDALRRQLALPGTRILQLAFRTDERADDSAGNSILLPHRHEQDIVLYTGTHDTNTACGWWAEASEAERERARHYLRIDTNEIHWELIRVASASVANTAIHPLQDVLGVGAEARMNRPGRPDGNWRWRFKQDELLPWHAQRLAALTGLYERG
ncbi:MAG: 4-alpha-glucanotransferase [Rhodocyclales bacterium]|nr:4-alpha-glucanotransferase [Rhodocyclales bacterium]